MSVNIVNASPQVVQLGADDKSLKPEPPRPIVVPTHLALIMSFAASGPIENQLVDGARLLRLYGSDTFDRNKGYFTHATRLAELLTGAGNAVMFKRIIPDDNDTIANVTIYLDVLRDDVDVLKRNTDGSYAVDNDGNHIVEKTVQGYKLKLIAEYNEDDENDTLGVKTSKQGYMEDADGNKSTMYPIIEQRAAYKGSMYNNIGVAFDLPASDDVNETYKDKLLALPYKFYLYERSDSNTTGKIVKSMFGSESQQFVFIKDAKDPTTFMPISLTDVTKNWYNLDNPLQDLVYPKITEPYIYYDNLDTILSNIMEVEKEYVNANVTCADGSVVNTNTWMDYVADVDATKQYRIINPFTATSTKRVPAFTYILDDSVATLASNHKEIYFSNTTPIYMDKGKDGTMNNDTFEQGVKEHMAKYLDKNSEVMDTAINIENVFYDTGFTLDTKKELINFITVRKDTFLGLSTYTVNDSNSYNDLVTVRAIALTLKSRLNLAIESTYFGTSTARSILIAGSGIDELDPSRNRYPLLMDIAVKAGRMMGGEKWKKELLFDRGDKNIILNYSDIQPSFIPQGVKPDLWNIGVVWPQPFDRRAYYFPDLQGVYDIDNSALNNLFMAMALTTTVKVADAAGRKFSGSISLSPSQLIEQVEDYMNKELNTKFDGIILATAKASITDVDEQRGYSWTVVTKLGGEIMKTVMTHYTEVWRKEDLV